MKAKDKPKFVKEARQLLKELDVDHLTNNPNDLITLSKINRLIAIFTNFSSNDGKELKRLLQEYQKWGRRSTRVGHIKNRVVDVLQFIDQKIEEMDIYDIQDEARLLPQKGDVQEKKVDVAFSFAGEQRDYVEKVALYVEREGGLGVFYDFNYELDMWGANLIDYFKNIFEKKANYCVMFISKEYASKTWPNFERQIIQAKSLVQQGYLLPARFDNTPLKGEIPTIKYVNIGSLSPEEFGEMVIKKVVGSDRYSSKKEAKMMTITAKANIATPESIPLLYIKPNVGKTGGPKGHFLYFTVKNMSNQILFDVKWGLRGFDYEWRFEDGFFEIEPSSEKELTFPLSQEGIFHEEVSELNVFFEYKDVQGRSFFVRRELRQEKVPSGAFYTFKAAAFHQPNLLIDDGLKLLSDPVAVGDRYEAEFQINVNKEVKRAKIGISKTFLASWDLTKGNDAKHAVIELGHRQMRKMAREKNIRDYVFATTDDYSQEYYDGFEGYKKLRDTI